MTIEITVPMLPESVADATVATWHFQPGDAVGEGDTIVDLETDKVLLEVPAPTNGVLKKITKKEGATVLADEALGVFEAGDAAMPAAPEKKQASADPVSKKPEELSPAVRRLVSEHAIDSTQIKGSGKGGRITRDDVDTHLKKSDHSVQTPKGERMEKRVPMSRMRARIAERLVSVGNESAMLTTFNEVNMQAVMSLRAKYKDQFEKTHGVRLGFMSFFTLAVVEALKRFPDVNASVDGKDIVYHNYFDVGIAVSTDRGLVVPVLRDADTLSMADIERKIREYALRAREGKLTLEEMTGGNFTITNGGVFGSLLSTPIINPPQSAILGMHAIKERPIAENNAVVIAPMMYLALSYDHRIVDGKTSVKFLVALKDLLEYPAQLLLDI
jgi:2-oxoglutarate dehydrogenase E2 component (dihydrolipoamide succinyltransferase)